MEGLVNYSSEEDQDEYPYKKVAVRERSSGVAACSGRTAAESSGSVKRSFDQSKVGSFDSEPFYRKGREPGNESFKSGNFGYNEDKYKIDRRAENSREHKEKREGRELKYNRDVRDDDRNCDSKRYDTKKVDDHKLYKEHKRDYKRDANDYYREDKRYNRYEEKKSSYSANNKDRFNRSRHDERKQYDDRFNEERKGNAAGNSYVDERKKEYNDRRSYNDDDRRSERRNDDRRTQRSYNEDRSSAYRPRRSSSPPPSHNKGINKYNDRRDEVNSKRERKRHSRSRSRSRSPGKQIETNPALARSPNPKSLPGEQNTDDKRPNVEYFNPDKKPLPTARNFEALLSLPLSENAPKQPNVVTVPTASVAAGSNATTTVQLPSYYNPNVINPSRYVEQMQKRKLIWGAKKTEDSASKWGHAQFSQDQDGKVASKFMRLMGIKNASSAGSETTSPSESEAKSPSTTSPPNNIDVKSREAMFNTMEHQYEVARQVTHTMRGVGLGFSSQSRPY